MGRLNCRARNSAEAIDADFYSLSSAQSRHTDACEDGDCRCERCVVSPCAKIGDVSGKAKASSSAAEVSGEGLLHCALSWLISGGSSPASGYSCRPSSKSHRFRWPHHRSFLASMTALRINHQDRKRISSKSSSRRAFAKSPTAGALSTESTRRRYIPSKWRRRARDGLEHVARHRLSRSSALLMRFARSRAAPVVCGRQACDALRGARSSPSPSRQIALLPACGDFVAERALVSYRIVAEAVGDAPADRWRWPTSSAISLSCPDGAMMAFLPG